MGRQDGDLLYSDSEVYLLSWFGNSTPPHKTPQPHSTDQVTEEEEEEGDAGHCQKVCQGADPLQYG